MTETKEDALSATTPDLAPAEKTGPTIDERIANFNIDLKAILGKYNLALLAEARIFQGIIVADPKVVDAEEYKALSQAKSDPIA